MKTCSRCKKEKPLDEFYDRASMCKPCHNEYSRKYYKENIDEARKYNKKRYNENKEMFRESNLRSKYGLSLDEWNRMNNKQGGLCMICGKTQSERHKTFKHLCVDHNHTTGGVRGLLCHPCNTAIGLLYEDSKLFERAGKYLRRYE